MNIIEDIKPLSTFKQKAADIIAHVKETQRPTFITVNGNVEVVLQDAAAYQEMVDLIEYLKNVQKIASAIDEADKGASLTADQAFSKFRANHKIKA